MNLNDSNKLNRANYEIDLMNWHGHAKRINNKNRLSYSSLDKMILNNNLDYYNFFVENNFNTGNIDERELDEITKYINSIEEYCNYYVDRNEEYSHLLTKINSFMNNDEEASEQAIQIMQKFDELEAKKVYPPEYKRNLFNLLSKLSPKSKGLLTESNSKVMQTHSNMSMLETVAYNINSSIKNVKEHGEYKGIDYVGIFKNYGELIKRQREYINSQNERLKSDSLSEHEIMRINYNIDSANEAIVDYLVWAEKAAPVLNKYGINVLKYNIPVSGFLDISMDIFDQLSISMAGIDVLDTATVHDIGMDVFPSKEIMVPIQVN
ncbi:hypothetical protein H0910_05300 [Providencia alcalifaciens]|uniref:hypothetical protein n=1 Tax=Providencia TaxID=586 RepID=UPI0015EC80AF|nr:MULTISPECIES: hypothetical protein [Providencia]QLQ98470.1 hypothetical protein H0910_05300 [Providencia alcalifaciens]